MEPKIRFIGHKLNWSVVALDKVTTARNASNALVNNRNLLSLSYGKIVNKDIDSNKGLLPSSFSTYQIIEPNTIVFRGTDLQNDKRSLRVAISKQKGIISPAYVTMDVTDENILPYYLYLAMHWHDVSKKSYYKMGDGLRQTLPYSVLKELEIPFPDKSEQQEIIAYFRKLDAKLQASAKKVESLKKLKSASLVAMFPQNGESMPKVRFKGFEGEWSTNNLGSIFAERIESNENGEMLSVTMNNGIIRSSDNGRFDNSNSDKSKYKVVKIGDIAYNSMRMWQGASGVSQYEGIVSPAYTVVTPSVDVDTDFFGYLFKTDDVIRLFKLNSQGLTSDNWNLKYPAFSRICVSYPESKEEQQAIAAYFRSLDRKIALETARLEKLKQIKLACLDKMFV
ncbi:MAG: restriction endonuclease subunit S [Prevotellamassilia sp.]|nr:restriction endonuclease subunit S [Prevotellamassilia sp.]